jgi:hypothetical protein
MALTLAGTPAINGLALPTDTFVSGMVLVNKTDFSAASSVSINNCFSATYENYRIITNVTAAGSGDVDIYFRLRASGTDNTANIYSYQQVYATSTTVAGDAAVTTFWRPNSTSANYPNFTMGILDLFAPQINRITGALNVRSFTTNAGGSYIVNERLVHNTSASFDGFTISTNTSNATGTVRVYGLRNS